VPLARPRSFDVEGEPEFLRCTHRIRELIFGNRADERRAA
jgi:hypothetical protein